MSLVRNNSGCSLDALQSHIFVFGGNTSADSSTSTIKAYSLGKASWGPLQAHLTSCRHELADACAGPLSDHRHNPLADGGAHDDSGHKLDAVTDAGVGAAEAGAAAQWAELRVGPLG